MPRDPCFWIGNLDGDRQALVIARTKKAAIEALNLSRGEFERYFGHGDLAGLAVLERYRMNTTYTRPIGPIPGRPLLGNGAGWIEGRCEIKRR